MLKTKKLIAVLSFAIIGSLSNSNAQNNWCHTHEMSEKSLQENPHLRQAVDQLEAESQAEQFNNSAGSRANRVIPVVVHIIHNYGSENISREQVIDAIRILNEDFQLQNSDQSFIVPAFQSIKGNPDIEFRLASKDPNGNCTDGINRIVSELTFNADDNVKTLPGSSWPRNRYFNIWVVDRISFGAGGYAYIPGTAPSPTVDGVVVLNTQFGSIGQSSSSNLAARTLTHEAGHWLNLRHTWGGTNTPGVTSNCSTDDGVSDTPNTVGVANQSCNLTQNTCNSLDNVQNYLDYSTCGLMFTQGQTNRMNTALNSTAGQRSSLWTAANLIATGTSTANPTAICAPKVDFVASAETACAGSSVSFTDLSFNAPIDESWIWEWSFPGGNPVTSNLQNPSTVYDAPGVYNVTLTVTNSGGSASKTISSVIVILPLTGTYFSPFFESFENANFPQSDVSNGNWLAQPASGASFNRTTTAAYTGSSALRYQSNGGGGDVSSIITPSFNMTELTGDYNMKFKLAYRPSNNGSRDQLRVFSSQNCGQTWSPRYIKSGTSLNTVGNTGSSFLPQSQQEWREETVNLSSFVNSTNLIFKFEFTDSTGARVFIDDINIGNSPLSNESLSMNNQDWQVYPNPSSDGQLFVQFNLLRKSNISVKMIDLLGRTVLQQQLGSLNSGEHQAELSGINQLSAGTYILNLKAGDKQYSKRVVLN